MSSDDIKEAIVADFVERMAPVSGPRHSEGLSLIKSDECLNALHKLKLSVKETAILEENKTKPRRRLERPNLRVSVAEEDLRPSDPSTQALHSPTASCKVRRIKGIRTSISTVIDVHVL